MQIVSSIVYFILISIKTSKFQVFEDLVGACTLRRKTKVKWNKRVEYAKCASPNTFGDTPYSRVSPFVIASDP